jgi:putative nucleotidyltransferase with HDIG domain
LQSTEAARTDVRFAPGTAAQASEHTRGGLLEAVLRYPARHISWRIIAPFALLTLLFAATGTYLTTSIVGSSLQERFDNRLLEAGRAAADTVVLQERKHLEVARTAAFTAGVAEAAARGDSGTLRSLLLPIAGNSAVDEMVVVGAGGEVLFAVAADGAGTYTNIADDGRIAALPVVAKALRGESDEAGDKFSDLVDFGQGYTLATVAPVYRGEEIVGAVLVGTRLESLLPVMKASAFADVTFYSGGAPIASTFAGNGQVAESDLTLRAGGLPSEGALKEERSLFGRDYTLLYGALEVRDREIGAFSVALANDFVTSAGGTAAWQMALLFGGGTAVVFAVGWAIARSLTEPVFRLLGTARRVTTGDLTARSGIEQDDEIGALAKAFDAMTQKLQQQHLATIRALTSAIDARDPYTLGHSVRVAQLSVELGRRMALPKPMLQHIEVGGYLHDIGKIGIRDAVLLKPGALTPKQRTIIEDHPRIGLQILEPVDLAPEILAFVGGHHERLNGSGYPAGLTGEEISIVPRIGAVADVYDALTTDRPYRKAMTMDEALDLLRREAGEGLLDPVIVSAMAEVAALWEERRRDDPALQGYKVLEMVAT